MVAKSQSRQRFYQPELDGLRFYAFLAVFVCHAFPVQVTFYKQLHLPLPELWTAAVLSGASGVDLFFVLSAFLITSLLSKEREATGDISVRLFYVRRVLRIWPLYFLVVVLGVAIAHSGFTHFWYYGQSLPWYYVAGYMLSVSNWVYAVFGAPGSICAPLWTVSIEEQFYLVWPLLAKLLRRRGWLIAGIVVFALATLSQIAMALSSARSSYLYFGTASRCDSLALGIILAFCVDKLPKLGSAARLLLISGGLIFLVAATALIMKEPEPVTMRMILGRLMISLASVAILYGCLHSSSRLLRAEWVVRLGRVSYGLYMLHYAGLLIMLSLIHPSKGWALLATKVLGLLMTVLLAFASYRWVELPFLRLKSRFATVPSRPVQAPFSLECGMEDVEAS